MGQYISMVACGSSLRYTFFVKSKFFLISALLCLFMTETVVAQDNLDHQTPEQINSYNVDLLIQNNGQLRVVESITYDFGNSPDRHGINRDIPYSYIDSYGKHNLEIEFEKTVNQSNVAYEQSLIKDDDYYHLKIGSPNITVEGENTYVITYKVKGAIDYSNFDHDQLIWTAIGSEWSVPIQSYKISLMMEGEGYDIFESTECFTDYDVAIIGNECDIINSNEAVIFRPSRPLKFQEGITIDVKWPKGLIAKPAEQDLPTQDLSATLSSGFFNKFLGQQNLVFALLFLTLF